MGKNFISSRVGRLQKTVSPIVRFATESKWALKDPEEKCSDFTFGNPHEMPLTDYVDVLQKMSEPKIKTGSPINKMLKRHRR